MARFKRVDAGDSISAAQYNLLLTEVERLGKIGVSGPLTLDDGPGGIVIGASVSHKTYPIQIAAAAGGGGYYTGTLKVPPATNADETADLALAGFEDGDTVIVANAEENSLPTHWIKDGAWVFGRYIGIESGGDYRQVFLVDGGYYRVASPAELATGQVNEYSSTPDTHHWVRDEETSGVKHGDTPVKIMTAITAVELGLNGTSGTGRKLYAAVASRGIAFDAGGRCFDIDPEATELFEIDIPDDGITIENGSAYNDVTTIVVGGGLTVTDNGGGSVTVEPAYDCITDIRWESSTKKLQYSKDGGATWVDIVTFEAC
jgi:hypothetical protein